MKCAKNKTTCARSVELFVDVHVVKRHAIVDVLCRPVVNVVIGVHIVVLFVPLVVVHFVVLILLVVILYQFIPLFSVAILSHMFSLYSHGILGVVFTALLTLFSFPFFPQQGREVVTSRTPNCELHARKGAQISRHMERLADLRERRRRLSRARRPAPVALADWATAAAAPSAGVTIPWASRRAFQSSSESGSTSRALGASIARTGRAKASGPAET